MGNSLFSVLIANYNNAQYIEEALDSIIQQDYRHWEIVVVDDYSTDGSVEVIQSYIAKGIPVQLYINDENKGVAYTKKRCIDESNGEILGFLDPDDGLTPNALSVMVKAHDRQPEASLISSNLYVCDSRLQKTRSVVTHVPEKGKSLLDIYNLMPAVGHFSTFKKEMYLRTVGMNVKYKRAVDQDLYLLLDEVGDLGHVDEFLYLYRIHDGGISLGKNYYKALASHIEIIQDTCQRRGMDKELYLAEFLERRDSSFNLKYIIKKTIKDFVLKFRS